MYIYIYLQYKEKIIVCYLVEEVVVVGIRGYPGRGFPLFAQAPHHPVIFILLFFCCLMITI